MDIALTRTVTLRGVAILVAIIARRLRLPYTVGLVITGIGLAVARLDTGAMLTHDFIFEVVLPPLLFEAALCIRWRELRRDLVVVLTPSTLGVVISAVVVGAGLMHLLAWPAAPALVFMGEPPISRKAFGNKLGGRPGIEPVTIGHKKARGYRGIRVITVETATNWRDD